MMCDSGGDGVCLHWVYLWNPFFLDFKDFRGYFLGGIISVFLKEGSSSELLSERDVVYGLDWWW